MFEPVKSQKINIMPILPTPGFDKSFEVQFRKDGTANDPAELRAAIDGLAVGGPPSDLFLISHGWNNDMNEARSLYAALFKSIKTVLDANSIPGLANRNYGIVGVLWPSKKFTDSDLIAGGAASADQPFGDDAIKSRLESLKGFFDKPDEAALERAKQIVQELEDDPAAQAEFVKQLQSVLPPARDTTEDPAAAFFVGAMDDKRRIEMLKQLSAPLRAAPVESTDVATEPEDADEIPVAGGSAGLGDLVSGMKAAAQRLMNYVTFYQMKERAGVVGSGGVYDLLVQIRQAFPEIRLHLIGHSFGGRLVAAAANGRTGRPAIIINTMSLLQAAFSHNGFALAGSGRPIGFFRDIIERKKISGPVFITYTANDKAVGLAYPLASRLANQQSAAIGDEKDPFGGIGRNGAINLTGVDTPVWDKLPLAESFTFRPGRFHNLNADAVITNHSDITHDEVAQAILAAVATT